LNAYADSSFIVALYLQQQSSSKAIAWLEASGQALPFTPWHRLEVRNAIRLAVCHQVIDPPQAKTQLKQIETDLKEETLIIHQSVDWTDALRQAEKLGAAHNERIGCRSADLFHVAMALQLGAESFLTFDDKQSTMAKAAGLTVKP
jgi:predicted nucleic acid-binding protein